MITPPYLKNKLFWRYAGSLLLVIFGAYMTVFRAGFISWDDSDLILNNPDVRGFHVKAFFTTQYTGNYMPLTMLLHGVEWFLFGDSPAGYHILSLLIHCVNCLFVFVLSLRLLKHAWPSFLCSVIFALHPLQVESVAWLAETKTVLSALFFFLATERHLDYLDSNFQRGFQLKALLFFTLSVLCKPIAVCFPLCLLCIDLLTGRTMTLKAFTEKIPFFIVAILAGVVTIFTQRAGGYINTSHDFAFYERIGYAGFALLSYCGKFFVPLNLSVIYPYPAGKTGSVVAGFFFLVAMALVIYLLFRKKRPATAGAVLFTLSALVLVLQIIPFGEVLTADRYTYLAIPGFSWTIACLAGNHEKVLKPVAIFLLIIFSLLTFARTQVWKSSTGLYSDILAKYPNSVVALNSLGAEYMLQGKYKHAHDYIGKAIALSPQFYKAWYNNGLISAMEGNYTEALRNFDMAIKINHYPKAVVARGGVYYELRDYARAINDANDVLEKDPNNYKSYLLLGNCFNDLNQLDKAVTNYDKAISIKNNDASAYLKRAVAFGKMQQFDKCLSDLEKAVELFPGFAEAYYWKGVAEYNLKKDPCADLQKAASLGFYQAKNALANYCR